MVKGVGLRLLSCRGSWVQIPPPALVRDSVFVHFSLVLQKTKLKICVDRDFNGCLLAELNH